MTGKTFLLVGTHFRPPAEIMLKHLPSGAELRLEPEPDNPYDSHAVKVFGFPKEIPSSEFDALREELTGCGWILEELLAEPEIWLGYLAASGGKPLQKAQESTGMDLAGNQEASELEEAKLGFAPNGLALVRGGLTYSGGSQSRGLQNL